MMKTWKCCTRSNHYIFKFQNLSCTCWCVGEPGEVGGRNDRGMEAFIFITFIHSIPDCMAHNLNDQTE